MIELVAYLFNSMLAAGGLFKYLICLQVCEKHSMSDEEIVWSLPSFGFS
jgi:hypothetical protein